MTQQQFNNKIVFLQTASLLVAAYPENPGVTDPVAVESFKITQFERMYGLVMMAFDETNILAQRLFPTPTVELTPMPVDVITKAVQDNLPALLKLIPGIGGVASAVASALPALKLPSPTVATAPTV